MAYIYTQVEESLYNRIFIGHYKSVAYQAVSITVPKGCSSGFVHWFPVWFTTTALWEETVRFQGCPQANLPLHPGNCIYSLDSSAIKG